MKKFSSVDLGGAPIFKNDLRELFNLEIWDAMQSILSPFNSDSEGIVVYGCAVTANAGNFDISSGIVFLNNEFMRMPAQTNQSFTKYIVPGTIINDTRTFQDGITHNVTYDSPAALSGSTPGSGQYITISSLTDLNDRRWSNILANKQVATQFQLTLEALGGFRTAGSGAYLKTKIIQIGDWNMDSTNSVSIAYSAYQIPHLKVRSVSIMIFADAAVSGVQVSELNSFAPGVIDLGWYLEADGSGNPVGLNILRTTGGNYDGLAYNATSYNRGYVTFIYEA
jgi:hypothetical protein